MRAIVKREDSKVRIRVDIEVPGEGRVYYMLSIELGNRFYAAFVADAIREQFNDHMARVRREAYEAGWKDAKAKRRKQKWFHLCW